MELQVGQRIKIEGTLLCNGTYTIVEIYRGECCCESDYGVDVRRAWRVDSILKGIENGIVTILPEEAQ